MSVADDHEAEFFGKLGSGDGEIAAGKTEMQSEAMPSEGAQDGNPQGRPLTPTMVAAHRLVQKSYKRCVELRALLKTIAPNGDWEKVVEETLVPRQIEFLRLRMHGYLIREIAAQVNLNQCYVGQSIKRAISRLSLPRPWPPRPRFNMPRKMSKEERRRQMKEGAVFARNLETAFSRERAYRWRRRLAPLFAAAVGLPPREAQILDGLRYGWTLQQLGDELGVTRERVRQIAARAYLHLRSRFVPQKSITVAMVEALAQKSEVKA